MCGYLTSTWYSSQVEQTGFLKSVTHINWIKMAQFFDSFSLRDEFKACVEVHVSGLDLDDSGIGDNVLDFFRGDNDYEPMSNAIKAVNDCVNGLVETVCLTRCGLFLLLIFTISFSLFETDLRQVNKCPRRGLRVRGFFQKRFFFFL